jgi:glycosyltransferase involved in cell wall biosynthesis
MDVFVLSSKSEGLSLTLLEAEAAALPIVATRVGGNPEVVHDGDTGFLVPSGDEAALGSALARLLQDRGLRARLGARGRASYCAHFTLQAMVDGYDRLYRHLAGRPERPPVAHAAASAPQVEEPV